MELSIIIVHYRNPAVLKLCLKSIFDTPPDLNYEVIVVDSASQRQSRDLIKEQFPQVHLIVSEENTGYAKGVNLGLAEAKGKFIMILNYDTIITDGALSKMVSFLKDRLDIGLLGPQLLNTDGSIQHSYFRYYTPMTIVARRLWPVKKVIDKFIMAGTDENKIQTPDWLMGAALMTSREAVNKIGPMDEGFFFYFEDVDWAKRFWQNGYKVVYYPEAKIYHSYGRGSKTKLGILDLFFNKKTRWHIVSAIRFFWKYRHKVRTRN